MLESVRRSARSGYSYVLVAALILVFAVSFGVQRQGCEGGQARRQLASVAGDRVLSDDLNVIYNQVYGSRQRGEDAQVQRQQALALKAYLMIELLAHKAREAGLRVSEQEFQEYMKDPLRNPEFASAYGQNGSWDGQYYKRYVQNFLQISLPKYEEFKHNELLARKYLNLVDMQIGVLPQQVSYLSKIRNTKMNLEFVKFQPTQLAPFVQIDDAQVAAYLSQNADKVKKYYDGHKDEYGSPAQMKVRRIYLEKGKKGPEGKTAAERFELAKKRLDAGEDFATVAGEINDAFKEKQGLMDMASVDDMNQDIVDALSDAKVGEVREIKSDNDLMLVKLLEKKEAVRPALAELQDDIARKLLQQEKVDALIDDLAKQLVAKAKQTGSLSDALAALKPAAPEGEQAAEDAKPKSAWSAVEVRETGEFTLEGQDMSKMFGGQLPPGVNLGRSPWDRLPKIGQNRKLAVDVFTKLTEKQPLAEQPYTVNDSKVVVRLKSKTTADAEAKADKGDEKDAEADSAGGEDNEQKIANELRDEQISDLVGQWQRLFVRRTPYGPSLTMDYGPWLEKQYESAVDAGVIELAASGGQVVTLIDPNAVSAEAPAEGAMPGAAGGSPIKVTPKAPAKGGAAGGSEGK